MIIVTDTSVVLNLTWLRQDALLPTLFDAVLAPPVVVPLRCCDEWFSEKDAFMFIRDQSTLPSAEFAETSDCP